jgi:hypothetical protein
MSAEAGDADLDIVSTRVIPLSRTGGTRSFTMHRPDGTDHPNDSVFVEVVEPQRIVLDHATLPKFRVTATVTGASGATTLVFRMRFPSAAQRAAMRTGLRAGERAGLPSPRRRARVEALNPGASGTRFEAMELSAESSSP